MDEKLSLKEAIYHYRQVAKDEENEAKTLWDQRKRAYLKQSSKEHTQVAYWLEDIQALREENEKLKKMLLNKFDPEEYVDMYNKLLEEESGINKEPFSPHENI